MKRSYLIFYVVLVILLLGLFSCDEKTTEPQDEQPPTVVITFPANNAEIISGSVVTILADANDNEGVQYVKFYIDGALISTDNYSPYEYEWDTSGITGSHTIYAKVRDTSENETTSAVVSVVVNEPIQNILSGYVTNSLGNPIEGAIITVTDRSTLSAKSNYSHNNPYLENMIDENNIARGYLKKSDVNTQINQKPGTVIQTSIDKEGNRHINEYSSHDIKSMMSRDDIVTNENGYYEITDLEEGNYTISVSADYYEEAFANITQIEGLVQRDFTMDASLLPDISYINLTDESYSIDADWSGINSNTLSGYNFFEQEFHLWSDDWTEDAQYYMWQYSDWQQLNSSLLTQSEYSFDSEEYNASYGGYALPVNIENEETQYNNNTSKDYVHLDWLFQTLASVSITPSTGPFYIPDNTHEISLHIGFWDSGYDPVRLSLFSWSVQISTDGNNWQTIGYNSDLSNTQVGFGSTKTFSLNDYKGQTVYLKTSPTEFPVAPTTLVLSNYINEYSLDGSGFFENIPPNPPSNPNPIDGSISVFYYPNLSWLCYDPNNDPLSYDVYFGTSPNPELVSSMQTENIYYPGTLDEETTYYWKIIAYDDDLQSNEGETWQFTTGVEPSYGTVTDIDGNTYQTVILGNQEWMTENLKVTHYSNGDAISFVSNQSQWICLNTEAYCYYDNNLNNASNYGVLYNWHAVADSRGLAPEGWHIPSDEEIMELEMYIGMRSDELYSSSGRGTNEGSKLAGRSGLWCDGDLEDDDAFGVSGFDFVPGGHRTWYPGNFGALHLCGYIWTSTEENDNSAWIRYINRLYTRIYRNSYHKSFGYSVRCVKD